MITRPFIFTPRFTLLTLVPHRKMAQIKTFAFFDIETTGLPHLENNKTRITELTIMSMKSEDLCAGVVPRVQNKLSLCFNPQKLVSYESERITGLSNHILEHLPPFTSRTVQIINGFLEHTPKPICFVAHNGDKFDYPILRSEIQKTGQLLTEDILCIDSLTAFRQLHEQEMSQLESEEENISAIDSPDSVPIEFQDGFDEMLCKVLDEYSCDNGKLEKGLKRALEVQKINETTPKKPGKVLSCNELDLTLDQSIKHMDDLQQEKIQGDGSSSSNGKRLKATTSRKKLNFGISFKLTDVYERLTNQEAVDAHRAECDVNMLAMCAAVLGTRFVDWANHNAKKFAEMPVMTPGRKIAAYVQTSGTIAHSRI